MLFLANHSNENISGAPSLHPSLPPPLPPLPLMECSLWSLCHQSSGASEGPWLPWRIFTRLILWILNCSDQQSATVILACNEHPTQRVQTPRCHRATQPHMQGYRAILHWILEHPALNIQKTVFSLQSSWHGFVMTIRKQLSSTCWFWLQQIHKAIKCFSG